MSQHLLPQFSNRSDRARHAHLLLLLPVVLACSLSGLVKKAVDKSREPTIIKSSDLGIQLTIPGGWRQEKKLNEAAILQAANPFEEMYVVVIKESKQDYDESATLDEYTTLVHKTIIAAVTGPQTTDPISIVVGSYPGREYELEGSVEKVKVKYICTAVETSNHFYQIVTWTLPSLFEKNQAKLRQLTQSFKELKSE